MILKRAPSFARMGCCASVDRQYFATASAARAEDELVKQETEKMCPKLWLAATIHDVKSFAHLYNQEVVNVLGNPGFLILEFKTKSGPKGHRAV